MRTRRPNTFIVALAAVALAIGAAACGDDDAATTTTVVPGPSETTTPGGSAPISPESIDPGGETPGVRGGTLIVGTAGELATFDPARVSAFGTTVHPLTAVYDTLLRLDDDGSVMPNMASMSHSDDLTEWTMTLQPGIHFSDGSPLDAEAVSLNVERHMDPEVSSQSFIFLSDVDEVEVVDDQTLTFRLSEPNVAFDVAFTLQLGLIAAPATLIEGYDIASKPVGAGPFILRDWQRDNRMNLDANPDYWQDGLPHLEELVFQPIPNVLTRQAALRSSDIHLSTFLDPDSLETLGAVNGLTVDFSSGDGGDALYLNSRNPPLDDIRVRRALAQAINLDVLDQVLFDGGMMRADGPFTPESPWYLADNGYPAFDAAAARAAVEAHEAETGAPIELSILVSTAQDRVLLAEVLQSLWGDVGIDVSIVSVDAAETTARYAAYDFEIGARSVPGFTDPEPLLTRWFHSDSALSFSGLQVNELDAAFEAARQTASVPERIAAYQEVSRLMAEHLPALWYTHTVRGVAHVDNLTLGPGNRQNTLWYQEVQFLD